PSRRPESDSFHPCTSLPPRLPSLSLVFVCLVCFVVFNERSVRVPLWGSDRNHETHQTHENKREEPIRPKVPLRMESTPSRRPESDSFHPCTSLPPRLPSLSLVFVCLVCFVVFNERSVRVPLWGSDRNHETHQTHENKREEPIRPKVPLRMESTPSRRP